jgi:hypothetical protein
MAALGFRFRVLGFRFRVEGLGRRVTRRRFHLSLQPLKCTKAFCSVALTLRMRDGCHLQTSPVRAHTDRHARAGCLSATASATRGEGRPNTQHKTQGTSERAGGARTCRPARRTPCTCPLPSAHAVSESSMPTSPSTYRQSYAKARIRRQHPAPHAAHTR